MSNNHLLLRKSLSYISQRKLPNLSTLTSQTPNDKPNTNTSPHSFLAKPQTLFPTNNMIPTATPSPSPPDIVSSNKTITNYIRTGDINSARQLFENMKLKTTITWNSMLAAYSKKPGKLKEARQLFDQIPQPDVVSYNTMLACYFHNSDIESANVFFRGMPVKDIASWNTMISGLLQNGKMDEAFGFFELMPHKNGVSWSALISGYAEAGDLDSAVDFFRRAPVKSVFAWTAMVNGYMKFGMIKMAERLFEEMPTRNLVSWNTMIAGYVEHSRAEDGLKLFRKMLSVGVRPNPSTYSSVLLGCSNLSALELGKQVHQVIYKSPLYHDITVGTSLLSMYCKCGNLDDARKIFSCMRRRDIVTWNSMISGYAQHGCGEKAIQLFDEMRNKGMKPDWISFIGVLTACNHTGLVSRGIQCFNSMKDCGVNAMPDHYTCMVDLLGRAGLLSKAVELINGMPFKPHVAIFGTLLGACRIHKNLEFAEFAAKNLLNLDPRSAAGYVQLANVYATMKKWDNVARVRQMMKENKVVKMPGYSWIEIKNVIHEFRSGDRVHPELESIHQKLHELEKKMKLAGYVAHLEFALHDVEEQQKEFILLRHSEKLAIAFGLMNTPQGFPIRVFKNLRVCGDCHNATKYISAIENREVIVRDTTRFHHFKNGNCSCGDYW